MDHTDWMSSLPSATSTQGFSDLRKEYVIIIIILCVSQSLYICVWKDTWSKHKEKLNLQNKNEFMPMKEIRVFNNESFSMYLALPYSFNQIHIKFNWEIYMESLTPCLVSFKTIQRIYAIEWNNHFNKNLKTI